MFICVENCCMYSTVMFHRCLYECLFSSRCSISTKYQIGILKSKDHIREMVWGDDRYGCCLKQIMQYWKPLSPGRAHNGSLHPERLGCAGESGLHYCIGASLSGPNTDIVGCDLNRIGVGNTVECSIFGK